MNSDKKIAIFLAGFILIGVMVTVFFPKEREKNGDAVIRIGLLCSRTMHYFRG